MSVTSFTPGRATAGATVTIKGLGFTPSSSVLFNGRAAASVSYVSATTLKAVVPAGVTSGVVTVTNSEAPAGGVQSAGSFIAA
jgi:hypothetical protein